MRPPDTDASSPCMSPCEAWAGVMVRLDMTREDFLRLLASKVLSLPSAPPDAVILAELVLLYLGGKTSA